MRAVAADCAPVSAEDEGVGTAMLFDNLSWCLQVLDKDRVSLEVSGVVELPHGSCCS